MGFSPMVIDKRTGQRYTTGNVQGALDLANNLSRGGAPGASLPGSTQYYKGTVAGQQSQAGPNGSQSLSFGNTVYKPGVTPGSSTFKPNAVQPGQVALPGSTQASNIQSTATNAVTNNINSGVIKEPEVQHQVNAATSRLTEEQASAKRSAGNYARASGFMNSGDNAAGMADIDSAYGAKRNAAAQDIRMDAAAKNAGLQAQAIGQGIQLAGLEQSGAQHDADRASADNRYNTELYMKQNGGRAPGEDEFTLGGFQAGVNAMNGGGAVKKNPNRFPGSMRYTMPGAL